MSSKDDNNYLNKNTSSVIRKVHSDVFSNIHEQTHSLTPSPSVGKLSEKTPSFNFLLCVRNNNRRRYDSNTTDTSSLEAVVRQTTSWRWIIVLGSFGCHFIADGLLFSFGVLMHTIKTDLQLQLHTIGIIASLLTALPLLLAPVSSALVNKFGCRKMTMLGGLISSIGLFTASMMGTFFGVLFGIGILCGIGLSFVYVPAVVIVAHYFDENRALATGLAVGGTGLGNAIMAQLIHVINDYYSDWRQTTLLLSAILLFIIPFGALFRPVEFHLLRKEKDRYLLKDSRLPSFMTSVEKLHRFIREMDKASAIHQHTTSTTSADVDEQLHMQQYENISLSGSDFFESYSADDITEMQQVGDTKTVDINTFRKNIMKDRSFVNKRYQKAMKKQLNKYKKQEKSAQNSISPPVPPNSSSSYNWLLRVLKKKGSTENCSTVEIPKTGDQTLVQNNQIAFSDHKPNQQTFLTVDNEKTVNMLEENPLINHNDHPAPLAKVDNKTTKQIPGKRQITAYFQRRDTKKAVKAIKSGAYSSVKQQHDVRQQLLQVYYQPINQKDIFYRGNVPTKEKVALIKSCPDLTNAFIYDESTSPEFPSFSSSDNEDKDTNHRHRLFFYQKSLSFLKTLKRMLGLHVFRDYRYIVFFISQLFFYLFYDLVYIFPVDYGETTIGYSKTQMTWLVSILGLGQFFGQLLCGFLANFSCLHSLILYNIGTILCGIATCLVPVVIYSYVSLLFVILLFGLSISANYALTSIILAEMCGLEMLTSAYGLVLLIQGCSSLVGPIVGGYIAEHKGYTISFYIAGFFMFLSGTVTFIIPGISWFRRRLKPATPLKK